MTYGGEPYGALADGEADVETGSTLIATLPALQASLSGSVEALSILQGTLPSLTASLAGTVAAPSVVGTLDGVLPTLEGSLSGEVSVPVVPTVLSVALQDDHVLETPAGLALTIGNGQPGETVSFAIVDVISTFQSVDLDDFGIAQDATVNLPQLAAGTYTLRTSGTLSGSQDTLFVVRRSPLAQAPIVHTTPVRPATAPITRWRFYDLRDDDVTWTFPHNPKSWSNVFPPNDFTHGKTTAPDGDPLTWQAAARPWRIEAVGYLDTQEEYEQLVFWSELRRRFWLIDHRNRAWLLTIEHFDAQAKVQPNEPWAHDYTLKMLIFMQG